jgi:shikimate kinase
MRIILLTGPKHSGKTSTGKAMAEFCSGTFIDLDEMIEQRTGKSPRALYKAGSEIFKNAEAESLRELLNSGKSSAKQHDVIVAAGGGLIDNGEALSLLADNAVFLVYLEVSAETAWKRIEKTSEKTGELPPFLDTENPEKTHRALHERRAASYKNLAHIIINAENKDPGTIAREIILAPKQ